MALWNGVIAFGLVSIPVKLRAATGSHDLAMHQYHEADSGRIRYLKVCELDDEPVEEGEIARGVETEEGEIVYLDEDDLEDLAASASKIIEVLQFVPEEQIDPIHYERSYYAEPGKNADKPYLLLREALDNADKIAVVKLTLRRRESLAVLRPRGDALLLHTMLWPDEIRKPDTADLEGEVRAQELAMAGSLIDSMTGDWNPEEYSDTYQDALRERIEAKKEGRTMVAESKEKPAAKVIDLMDALKQSVDQAGAPRGKRRPVKKAAKKAAKKTAAKKTAKKAAKSQPARKRKSALAKEIEDVRE
jgi:DNA end-binding protein Ku